MNALYIEWRWITVSISLPEPSLQDFIQKMAMGVIYAHQDGNVSAVAERRGQEKTTHSDFDPTKEKPKGDAPEFTVVKECIFERPFEEKMICVSISHCWTSLMASPAEGAPPEETDLAAHYLVEVQEISGFATSIAAPDKVPEPE